MRSVRRDEGFTLLELLIVMIILSILAAISIPTFLRQRQKAWERVAQSDVRHGAIQAEMYYDENDTYVGLDEAPLRSSDDTELSVTDATVTEYCLEGDHRRLDPEPDYHFDLELGRPVAGGCA